MSTIVIFIFHLMHISTPTNMIHVEVQYGWDHDYRGRSEMKYSLCFSVIWLIVPDNILTTRKLQDAVSNGRGHGWQDKTRKGKQQQKNINKNCVRWGDSHSIIKSEDRHETRMDIIYADIHFGHHYFSYPSWMNVLQKSQKIVQNLPEKHHIL